MKTRIIKEESDDEDKEENFGEDPEYVWYKRFMYLTLRIDMLFYIKGTTLKKS